MQIDTRLLSAAKAGDPTAMGTLLTAVRPDVRRCAIYYCGRVSAVDEVVQETLWVVSRRLGTLHNVAAFAGWVATIVTRICLWPALKLARGVEQLTQSQPSLPARPIEELRLDIARALESLPEPLREVVLMRDFEGLTIGEMALQLRLSRAATKSRLHRARALIREYLVEGDGP
jgi:RNA polymerase sigma factor (sigma-70 family)